MIILIAFNITFSQYQNRIIYKNTKNSSSACHLFIKISLLLNFCPLNGIEYVNSLKNKSLTLISSLVCSLTLTFPISTFAGDQIVDIEGHSDCNGVMSDRCGWDGSLGGDRMPGSGGDNGGGGSIGNGDVAALKNDVRCTPMASSDARAITSMVGPEVRYIAAQAVWANIRAFSVLKSEALKAGFITVTYADGGTEKWFVTNPTMSEGGLVEVPQSLKKGDGIARSCSVAG
ncbi:hypothetical protein ACO0K7_10610 [Undibacterium sp. Ji67W]|uniref:hypothetical protein n=1 Tax=Undibacterium sp. Ji67W TaxID=3413042 RepID=UPI003BF03B03